MVTQASLSSLPYDVFSVIARDMVTSGSQKSLLQLALASRMMCGLVIPEFLFARNSFQDVGPATFTSFCQRINARGSMAGNAVRHFEYTSCHPLSHSQSAELDDAMKKFRNVQSLKFWSMDLPRISKEVLSSYHCLRSIHLTSCMPASLATLPDFWELHVLSIQYGGGYTITPDSALGKVLIRSQKSLKELTLGHMRWQLGSPQAVSTEMDFMWPNVHTLNFSSLKFDHLDFARTFPSTRVFTSPHVRSGSDGQILPREFLARLESSEGSGDVIRAALDAGAKLRRIVQCGGSFKAPGTPLDFEKLPSSLRSLHVVQTDAHLDRFTHLSSVSPHLQFLCVTFNVNYDHEAIPMLEKLLAPLSHLPLKHLSLNVNHDARPTGPVLRPRLLQSSNAFLESASTLIPTLEALTVGWPSWNFCWKRVVDRDADGVVSCRFDQTSWADGCTFKKLHDLQY
ncbi:hypothetical protein BOTBODRAFT_535331 [Botryobasidium botryosum FD-172 SS1]|uniref:F-box domain-containing protein n=1 Tax=Botryobasidium botryosum (strain FD-172 SS1) TaxID=930990 RepID=A0A067M2Z2_BOTB1|nr:hypothetical protein BOTBODRAFT_535331 [Botryobasidium botryosum FD-172 SS1]